MGKTSQIIMPKPETRLAILASLYPHCEGLDQDASASWEVVQGGSINQTYRLSLGDKVFFVKLHKAAYISMFEAEAAGLMVLYESKAIRVPEVYVCTCNDDISWLVMSYIPLFPHTSSSEEVFAQQLAIMHHCKGDSFGWSRDNTIGLTSQINTPSSDWITFYREHRLAYQLKLAKQHGFAMSLYDKGERILVDMDVFFTNYVAQPSLLHGDLWSGNHASDNTGQPVVFDPAVYYGDREADMAMTELFGGLSNHFYAEYHAVYPLDEGYQTRKILYNLYHILNHANLFGGSYAYQAENMMEKLLAAY